MLLNCFIAIYILRKIVSYGSAGHEEVEFGTAVCGCQSWFCWGQHIDSGC